MYAVVRTATIDNVTPVHVFYVFTPSKEKADELCEMINGWIKDPNPATQRMLISAARTGFSFGVYDRFTNNDLAEVVELKEFNPQLGKNEYKNVILHKTNQSIE
jgi:hypothetical protein